MIGLTGKIKVCNNKADLMRHVFIIGCKGIPAEYGGFETFVDQLVSNQVSPDITYHVACAVDSLPKIIDFSYNGALCHNIKWRHVGSARAVLYDIDACSWAIDYVKRNRISHPIFYILACRIGPFISHYSKAIHKLGGVILVNPDGLEWKRAKWNAPIRRYWKISERQMVRNADLLICDSKNIEKYVHSQYKSYEPSTRYIAYGADVVKSDSPHGVNEVDAWFSDNNLTPFQYYLIVGRFVPENNYETVIREFMKSETHKALVIITKVEPDFLSQLEERTHFRSDSRIRFVGTVYDKMLLQQIRKLAFAYIHGHEVGGTNPSLLEALASTQLSLLLDVCFNREVAENSAVYWNKEPDNLSTLIGKVEDYPPNVLAQYQRTGMDRIRQYYSWARIVGQYENLFLQVGRGKC